VRGNHKRRAYNGQHRAPATRGGQSVPAEAPRITLTFDNGPDPEVTPQVLDVLARAGIKASFFVLGHKLQDPARRAAAERARAEGHWIGNHTFHHDLPLGQSADPDIAAKEIGRTQELMAGLTDERRLFRPFGGGGKLGRHLLGRAALDYLVAGKYTCVLWNAIPGDWRNPKRWVPTALRQCSALDWSLVVLHDLPTGAMDRLERFIGEAQQAGATFVQDFAPACVPIVRGRVVAAMNDYVTDAAAA
jgi:peptidoglycan/xylan/chitin deacetylase (PgdA/CDA1 family)